ncbi:uncharacterized protein LOC119322544 [Triticum dicoccoides]|uniref:uncharacterized protein LOC119322544 n=1 Tax=Triticum dicoccoides TaxID=85692 RepID=UPI001891D7C3|nr:uncharacterized protein LOC119322544 [Triticum dicoccoides]
MADVAHARARGSCRGGPHHVDARRSVRWPTLLTGKSAESLMSGRHAALFGSPTAPPTTTTTAEGGLPRLDRARGAIGSARSRAGVNSGRPNSQPPQGRKGTRRAARNSGGHEDVPSLQDLTCHPSQPYHCATVSSYIPVAFGRDSTVGRRVSWAWTHPRLASKQGNSPPILIPRLNRGETFEARWLLSFSFSLPAFLFDYSSLHTHKMPIFFYFCFP